MLCQGTGLVEEFETSMFSNVFGVVSKMRCDAPLVNPLLKQLYHMHLSLTKSYIEAAA